MKHNHFRLGRSTFVCGVCGRRTRDAGQGVSTECCPECFELSGLDNTVNDRGATLEEVVSERDALLSKAVKRGSDEARIRREFRYLFP